MFIRIGFEIIIECSSPTPLLLALLPHPSYGGRMIECDRVQSDPAVRQEGYLDEFANRRVRMIAPVGPLRLWSDCIVENDGLPDPFNWNARQHAIADLPPETLRYLTASRYCNSDVLVEQAWELFGETPEGWARVQAICNWVQNQLTFGYQFSRSTKTATDALRERTGVCRDFAQLGVAMCRAMNIPARYASGYLGDIGVPYSGPGDFCAWFEAYLENRWYTFDARYNTPRIGRVLVVRGRDAADAAMMTSFGNYDMKLFRVWTEEVVGTTTDAERLALLENLPDAPALTLEPPRKPKSGENGVENRGQRQVSEETCL